MFKKPFIAVAFATACSSVFGEDADITVTYSNFAQPLSQTTGQVRITGREKIELLGTLSVDQLLNQISGISVSSQGGLGQVSSIRMRGSDYGDVLVLIDGVPITDTTDIDLNPKTSILNSSSIERIEIVKGNQSAVWGSQALGGVINIITSDDEREITRAEFGAGSFGQKSTRVKSNWGNDSANFSIFAGYLDEDGFSALERRIEDVGSSDEAQAGLEKDPYRERTLMLQAQTEIGDNHAFKLSALDIESFINYDDPFGTAPLFEPNYNAEESSETKLNQLVLTHQFERSSSDLVKTQLSKTTNERTQSDGFEGSQTILSSRYQHTNGQRGAIYGITLTRDTLDLSGGETPSIDEFDTYELNTVQNWAISSTRFDAAVAYQIRSEFENGATYRLGFKHQFQPEIALGGNISTGFKAPSLYQLSCTAYTFPDCSVNQSRSLNPENSTSTELFLETSLGIWTVFRSEITDRIDWDNGYANVIGKSETKGWEYSHRFNSSPSISHSLSHTYVNAEDSSGARRVRIPETETAFRTLWAVSDPLLVGLNIRHTGSRLGNPTDEPETGNFTVTDLVGTYRITGNTALNVRIENLTDTFYQDAVNLSSGYATRARGYYLTLQSEF